MSFSLRVLAVGTATVAFVTLVATLLAPLLMTVVSEGAASRRAHRLGILRLIPAGAGAVVGLIVIASFLNFEPRLDENIGWMIPTLGGIGAMLIAVAVWRAVQSALATRRLTRDWLSSATPIDLPGISVPASVIPSRFPVVAVVGIRRPRLVIARSVLRACTPEELAAVLAHEQGHIDRRDNLRRLLMYAAPDALSWLPRSSQLASAWRAATEEAADDDAARAGTGGRLALASALVKVARLAVGMPHQRAMPVSTLYCGDSIDARVRRLLEPVDRAADAARERHPLRTAALLTGAIALTVLALHGVQALVELTVHTLP
jgi:hypothetical protein